MTYCKVCLQRKSPFILNNKTVCLQCDELLFDLEVEMEEAQEQRGENPARVEKPNVPAARTKR